MMPVALGAGPARLVSAVLPVGAESRSTCHVAKIGFGVVPSALTVIGLFTE
jgi:hypothetical protein